MTNVEYFNILQKTIADHNLCNWLDKYTWLTGHLGDPLYPVWFVGENPSYEGVNRIAAKLIDGRKLEESENLQWNCYAAETRMFREALTEAGLKTGDPCANSGWRCYITNAIKAPEVVKHRNARKNKVSMRKEAEIWRPVLQYQIDSGKPLVLVALGEQSHKLIEYMCDSGLKAPENITLIHHYSYVMKRYDNKAKLGAAHPDRIKDFKEKICKIAQQYGRHAALTP